MAGEPLFEMEFTQMAGDDDEVIVSLPPTDGGEAKIVKSGEKPAAGTGADALADDLKSQFATMTQRAVTAEQANQQTTQQLEETNRRLQHVEGQVVGSQLDTVLSGIAAAEAETKSAKQAFITAAEAGDFVAQSDAQERISDARARLQRLQEAKEDLEDMAKRRPDPGERKPPAAPARAAAADPVESLIANGKITGKSAAWIRAHPEVATDPKANARMLAAHNLAVADDIEVESPEYFQRIEESIKVTKAAPQQQKAAGDGRRPSSAAAPAAGAGGALNGGIDVTLTKGEAASATDGTLVWNYDDPSGQNKFKKGDPIGLAEMARRKHYGKKAGLYDKNAMEA